MSAKDNSRFFGLWRKSDASIFTKTLALYCAERSGRWKNELCNLIESNDLASLCTYNINYDDVTDIRDVRYARQCLAFFSKDADLAICNTELVAHRNFIMSETQNRLTNKRFSSWYQSGQLFSAEDSMFLDIARKISDILGECPKLEDLKFGFGPGSSTNVKQKTGVRYKLQANPACSEDMVPMLSELESLFPLYFNSHFDRLNSRHVELLEGELSYVDKNALTKRSIIIEPVLNTFCEKAIGSVMKQRLLSFGCNLYSQVKNQELALQGSTDGKVATVDLRNASNNIALLVVYHLLQLYCEDWYLLLEQTRCSKYRYKGGEPQTLEMFSSMGNGFTFELESLIFYATALVVTERCNCDCSLVSVYGDDICIDVRAIPLLKTTLSFLGFEVNDKKSFSSGPFRESCGYDYYAGQNIRPFYKKDRWTDARVIGLLNFDLEHYSLFDAEMRQTMINTIKEEHRTFGPSGFGDGTIHVESYVVSEHLSVTVQRKLKPFDPSWTKDNFVSKAASVLPPRYFWSFIKIPKKDRDEEYFDIGDRLAPLYDLYSKPSARFTRGWDQVFDVYGIAHFIKSKRGIILNDILVEDEVIEHDPFIIRGGWRSKKVKIYTHTL